MSTIKCPACNQLNDRSQLRCTRCQAPLPDETTVIVETQSHTTKQVPRFKPLPIHKQDMQDVMVVHIIGEEEPLVVSQLPRQITIGRAAPGGTPPDIDLGGYGASILGVSRLHAVITRTEHGYIVEDLNSTNGTYLNEQQLEPNKPYLIQAGDYLCLGQMVLCIQLEEGVYSTDTVYLSASRYTPAGSLLQDVTPYLAAVENLQQIVNELRGNPEGAVQLNSITPTSAGNAFAVTVSGAGDALSLVTDVIQPWKASHEKDLMQHGGQLVNGSVADLTQRCSRRLNLSNDDPQVPEVLVQPLQRLVNSHLHLSYEMPYPESV